MKYKENPDKNIIRDKQKMHWKNVKITVNLWKDAQHHSKDKCKLKLHWDTISHL